MHEQLNREPDWDDFSYADPEFTDDDDLMEKKTARREKSPERKKREEEFLILFNAFMNPEKQLSAFRIRCQADDLCGLLMKLNKGWTYRKAISYALAGFPEADWEEALDTGCHHAFRKLLEDKEAGCLRENPVAYYLKVAQNKSIDDYFRKKFGRLPPRKKPAPDNPETEEQQREEALQIRRRKTPSIISIESMKQDDKGNSRSDRIPELSWDPFDPLHSNSPNRKTCENRMLLTCLEEMMSYSGEPQKILALMYGKIIYQVTKDYGDDSPLARQAKSSPKLSSPPWAHARMGKDSLDQLGKTAQAILNRFYDRRLRWGSVFTGYMEQTCDDGTGLQWGQIVYTDTYTISQTSHWIDSISKSVTEKACRRLKSDRMVMAYVSEDLGATSKIRKALKKTEKEAVR